jgi:hypothetical protein
MYKLIKNFNSEVRNDCVLKTDVNMYIPFDPANTDYQEYLTWLAEGNEPLPADEPEGQTE